MMLNKKNNRLKDNARDSTIGQFSFERRKKLSIWILFNKIIYCINTSIVIKNDVVLKSANKSRRLGLQMIFGLVHCSITLSIPLFIIFYNEFLFILSIKKSKDHSEISTFYSLQFVHDYV